MVNISDYSLHCWVHHLSVPNCKPNLFPSSAGSSTLRYPQLASTVLWQTLNTKRTEEDQKPNNASSNRPMSKLLRIRLLLSNADYTTHHTFISSITNLFSLSPSTTALICSNSALFCSIIFWVAVSLLCTRCLIWASRRSGLGRASWNHIRP